MQDAVHWGGGRTMCTSNNKHKILTKLLNDEYNWKSRSVEPQKLSQHRNSHGNNIYSSQMHNNYEKLYLLAAFSTMVNMRKCIKTTDHLNI